MATDTSEELVYRPTREQHLLDDARPEIETKLLETLRFKSGDELKCYCKMPDVEIARAMMRSAVPLEVSDEAIKNTCNYIGNVLNNKAQYLARDINYVPKRRTRDQSHSSRIEFPESKLVII